MTKKVAGLRFWENMTSILVTASNVLTTSGTNFFLVLILFFGVAFDFKPIFGTQEISTLGRLTRSMRRVFRNLTILKKILNYFEIFEIIFENVPVF